VSVAPEQTAPQADEVAEPEACPRCGAAVDAGQEYCLECGLRLPRRDGLAARLGDAWQRRVPWYPGDWIWPALAFFVIAALGAGLAILSTHDGAGGARTITATTSVLSRQVTTTPVAPEPTVARTTTATATATQPRPKPRSLVQWPASRSGYTLVLNSIPKPNGLSGATAQAREALRNGLPSVGVLDSDQFSSLHPGYFVAFSGVYSNFADANVQLGRAHAAGYRLANPRRVTR
jgi:hypothetical protein